MTVTPTILIQPVVRTELAAHVTGTTDGQQILAALQIHILFEGSHIDLSCPRQPDADLLYMVFVPVTAVPCTVLNV